ncbi:MAG TPA: VWA domain-containing protein [Blastocatellia bacterium]|nr:VWA domain-containing protein [Blastocatellia bacterium]
MKKRKAIVACAVVLTLSASAALIAQQEPLRKQDEPIKLRTNLVTVTAAVTDSRGRVIKSLREADFIVYEDGVKQRITHFGRTEEPFTVLLLLDVSGSTRDELSLIKRAAKGFLGELRARDGVGLIVFSGGVEVIAEFTQDRARLEAAIDAVAAPAAGRFSSTTGTAFYDALDMAGKRIRGVEGRKAIVCMSDGVDSASRTADSNAAREVESSDASAYFLELDTEETVLAGLLKPPTDPGYVNLSPRQIDRYYDQYDRESLDRYKHPRTISPLVLREINTGLYEISMRELRQLAERSGGRVYPVSALTDLAAVYKQVADDLRSQYTLSYYPANETPDGRWRKITVETRRRDAKVRARAGYWAPSK